MSQQTKKTPEDVNNVQEVVTNEEVEQQDQLQWKEQYLRILADYDNLKRRSQNDRETAVQSGISAFISALLPAFDTLDLAFIHTQDEGITLLKKQFNDIFEKLGIRKIEVLGKPFDPYTMECIEVIEGKDGCVVNEIASGYIYKDKVVRPSKVRVGKKAQKQTGENSTN